jgi:O-antigen/teichoic acid export membrane protein
MDTRAWTESPPPGFTLAEPETEVGAGPAERGSPIGRNIAALAGGQLITWAMTLIWTLVVPRALGPAGMGLIVAAWSVTGILGVVLGLGTRTYLVREMVVNRSDAPRLVGTAIVLRLLLAPLFAVAVIVYAQLASYGSEGTLVLYLVATAAILTLLAEPMQAGFQALERMEYLAYSDVINKTGQSLLGVGLALLGFRAVGITASWVVVAGSVIVLDVIWVRRYLRVELRTSLRRLANMARHSFAYWAFGVFFLIYLWIDSVMLSLMTRPEVVGWYGVPTKLFQSLMFLPVVVSTAWLPRLVSGFEESPQRLRQAAKAPLELVLVLSLPICAATAIAAGPIIHLLYGPAYDQAVPVMIILGLTIPPMYLNIMLNQVLVAAKRQTSWTWVMAGATVVNPLLNAVLIRVTESRYDNGAIGAAISLLLTELLIVGVGLIIVGHDVVDRSSVRRGIVAVTASAAMWGAAYSARPLGTAFSMAAGVTTFVLLAAVFRLVTPEEMGLARAGLTRVTQSARGLGGRVPWRWRTSGL